MAARLWQIPAELGSEASLGGTGGVSSGSPLPARAVARAVAGFLTLHPPQVSGSLRRKAAPGTAPSELQELRSRTERAERRLMACENLVGELGSGLAALSTLLQGYGQLQQRLLNLENLLKNRNFWILRLPPASGGEIPKVAAALPRDPGTLQGLGAELPRAPSQAWFQGVPCDSRCRSPSMISRCISTSWSGRGWSAGRRICTGP